MSNETSLTRWMRTPTSEVWTAQGGGEGDAPVGELHLHYGESGKVSVTLCLPAEATDDDVGYLLAMVYEQLLSGDAGASVATQIRVWRGRAEQYAYQAQQQAPRPSKRRSGVRSKAAGKGRAR